MALFTDSSVIALDDLLQFESSLIDVCSAHGIDVRTKIKVATDGIGDRLMLWLLRSAQSDTRIGGFSNLSLDRVVVTPAIYRWLCFDALSRVFAEAYNVQLNTRFQGKWVEYQKEAEEAGRLVYTSGLGLIFNPMAKPALPSVSIGAGVLTSPAVFIQTAWIAADRSESAPSPINGVVLNGFAAVSIAAVQDSSSVPSSAIGWNVYISDKQQNLSRQNSVPILPFATWQIPSGGLTTSGVQPSGGQKPNVLISLSGRLQRG